MTAETWTAKAKLASFHVLQFQVGEDGSRTPRDDEPGPPQPGLPGPYPWRDEEERKLRIAALELKQLGRPPIDPEIEAKVKAALAKPNRPGVRVIAEQFGISPGTVQRISAA